MPVIRAALERGQHVRMTVNGSSMWPLIRNGDVVEIAPVPQLLHLGSVVLAQLEDGRYPLHRLVAQCDAGWLLRGDNVRQPDGIIPRQNLLGVATHIERHGHPTVFGSGRSARVIAWLSAQGYLWLIIRSMQLFRRAARAILLQFQSVLFLRSWSKRFCPAYCIEDADMRDLITVHTWMGGSNEHFNSWIEQNTTPNVTGYVAKRGEEILGFVRLIRSSEEGTWHSGYWLYTLIVRPRYRGMGIGEALTRRVIDQSRVEGASELCLCVFEDNRPAIALYRKLGFARVSLPAVEETLADDVEKYGRQRVPFVKSLS